MRRKRNSEINVFSTSAIDLFASGMGVFILLMVAVLPNIINISKTQNALDAQTVSDMVKEINNLTQINAQFLRALTDQTKNLAKVETQVRELASMQKSAQSKVEGLQSVAETIQATQSIVKDLVQSIKVINEQQEQTQKRLKRKMEQVKDQQITIQQLTKKNDELEKQKKEKLPYVSALLRWDIPKHDLDLKIIDPDGQEISFKQGSKEIYSDARSGPGGEIWYSKKPKPGRYKLFVYYHGSYGNDRPAEAQVSIIDSSQLHILPLVKINEESKFSSPLEFEVSEDGKVQIRSAEKKIKKLPIETTNLPAL
tara:strand:- start:158750 stop:159682 length:933 start_codon:yes stop_codon:yes gene_type:complete